jgi:hypothetical protein
LGFELNGHLLRADLQRLVEEALHALIDGGEDLFDEFSSEVTHEAVQGTFDETAEQLPE